MVIKLTAPLTRFGGWQGMGAVKRPADTRTTEELKETIKLWAKANSEVKDFLPHLKEINDKHLGLVADTIELSLRQSMLPLNINMTEPVDNGKSILGLMLESYRVASKENPAGLEFAQEVVNNTDTLTSKVFFLEAAGGVLENKNLSKRFKAATPLVEIFAKQTLEPPNPFSLDNQKKFMTLVKTTVNVYANPRKIPLVKELFNKINDKAYFNLFDFVAEKTPVSKLKDNMKTVEQVADMFIKNGKVLDAGEYMNKNTNLY